jgi:hypothetical protein
MLLGRCTEYVSEIYSAIVSLLVFGCRTYSAGRANDISSKTDSKEQT